MVRFARHYSRHSLLLGQEKEDAVLHCCSASAAGWDTVKVCGDIYPPIGINVCIISANSGLPLSCRRSQNHGIIKVGKEHWDPEVQPQPIPTGQVPLSATSVLEHLQGQRLLPVPRPLSPWLSSGISGGLVCLHKASQLQPDFPSVLHIE